MLILSINYGGQELLISTDFQEIMLEIGALLGLLASDENAPLPSKLLIDLLMEANHKEMALQQYS